MVSEANKARIIQQFFMGFSLRESQASMRKTVKSHETVRNVRDAFIREVEEKQARFGSERGLRIAARDWKVTELVDQLLTVGTEAHKAKVELHELIDAVPVAKILVEAGVDAKDLLRFIREVYNRSKQAGYTVESIMNDCQELNELEDKYGSFDKIKKEFPKVKFELTELESDREELNEQIGEAVVRKNKLLADYGTTEAKLKAFERTRKFLISIGITEDDAERAMNALLNIKDQKFNMKRVVSKLKSIEDLDDRVARQKAGVTKGEEDLERLRDDLESVETEITEKSGVIKEAHKVEESGLSIDQMAKLRATVVSISSKRGIPPSEAMAKFGDEVGTKYDLVLGFEQDLQANREEQKIAKVELSREKRLTEEVKQTRTSLENQHSKRKKEIDAYSTLRRRGVDDEAILRWERVVASTDLTPGAIESELVKAGDLSKLRKEMKEEADREEKRSKNSKDECEKLNAQIGELQGSVGKVARASIRTIKKIADDAVTNTKEVGRQTSTELGTVSATAVAKLNSSVSDLKLEDKADDVKKQLDSIRETAVKSLSDVEKAGEVVAKLEPIGRAYAFLAERKGDLSEQEVLYTSETYLQNLLKWMEERDKTLPPLQGVSFNHFELERAIKELHGNWSHLK